MAHAPPAPEVTGLSGSLAAPFSHTHLPLGVGRSPPCPSGPVEKCSHGSTPTTGPLGAMLVSIFEGISTARCKQVDPPRVGVFQGLDQLYNWQSSVHQHLSQQLGVLFPLLLKPLRSGSAGSSRYRFCFCLTCISSMQIALVLISFENSS